MRTLTKMLLIYWSIVIIMLLFTAQTNFNLIGYNLNNEDGKEALIIEEGYMKKQYHELVVTEENTAAAIQLTLSITDANRIWKTNMYILPIFIALLYLFLTKSFREQTTKLFKWYSLSYTLAFTLFIIWNINVNYTVFQEVVYYLSDI